MAESRRMAMSAAKSRESHSPLLKAFHVTFLTGAELF